MRSHVGSIANGEVTMVNGKVTMVNGKVTIVNGKFTNANRNQDDSMAKAATMTKWWPERKIVILYISVYHHRL